MRINSLSKGVGLSLLLHLLAIGYLLWQPSSPQPLTATAVIVEFSDPPQSIMAVQDLPIGPPQVATQASSVPPEEVPEKTAEAQTEPLPTLEQDPLLDLKPEIVVQKAEKPKTEKPKKAQDQAVKKRQPPKELTRKELTRKEQPKTDVKNPKNSPLVQQKAQPSEQVSTASGVANTAPPKGSSNKIAADFNSSGNSQSLEASWKGRVKARLERSLRYPEQALRKRWKGRPVLALKVATSGEILAISLHNSSGKSDFDREAISNAKRNSPLPKPPAELFSSGELNVIIPIDFDYDKFNSH